MGGKVSPTGAAPCIAAFAAKVPIPSARPAGPRPVGGPIDGAEAIRNGVVLRTCGAQVGQCARAGRAPDAVVRHVTMLEAAAGLRFKSRFQVGVEFQNLDDERKALIEETIRKHATHPP